MDERIEACQDSDIDNHSKLPQTRKRKRKTKRHTGKGKATESDQYDNNFVASLSDDDTSSTSEDDCVEITNEEVC